MKSVYLAGPIAGLSYDESTDWRQEAIKYLSLIHISEPTRPY